MSGFQLLKSLGRLATGLRSCSKYEFVALIGRVKESMPRVQQMSTSIIPRLSAMCSGTILASSGLLSCALAQGGQTKGQGHQDSSVGREWITNRVKGDICHLAPGISELMLDVLDLLQDRYDRYISSMRKRITDLEGNLKKYGSTLSLNAIDEDSHSLTDPGSAEIQQFRKDYRQTQQRSTDMLSGLDRFLLSAGQLGANTCVENCQREMQEICRLLDDLERKVHDYENKLTMAEKHFRTKMRRTANGPSK